MKKTIIFILILLSYSLMASSEVTIGDQQITNKSLPLEPYYGYSYSQVIYLQEDILAGGEITGIRYNYHVTSDDFLQKNNNLAIYMGHTTKNKFDSNVDWVPISEMTLMYYGNWYVTDFSDSLPGEGWVTIQFDSSFVYNNTDNLVIAFDENYDGYSGSSDEFYCTEVDSARGMEYHSDYNNPDPADPPEANYNSPKNYIANIKLIGITPTVPPTEPTNPNPPDMAEFVSFTPLLSWDSDFAVNYDVYLNDELIATYITQDYFQISDPLQPGTTYNWYVIANNPYGSTTSPTWTFTTFPEDILEIGEGAALDKALPIEPYYGYSYSQVIYLQSELGSPTLIDGIAYHFTAEDDFEDTNDIVIYMGHTDKTNFVDVQDWIPISELTQVFDGTWEITAGDDWVNINLDTTFVYNGMDNLVIAVDENRTGYDSSDDDFYCSEVEQVRGIMYRSDSNNPEPNEPPNATYLREYIANVRLFLEEALTGDLQGNVADAGSGLPIENAAITVGGYSDTTDFSGNYHISGMMTGTYDVICSAVGYVSETESEVSIVADDTTVVDFALQEYFPPEISYSPEVLDFEIDLSETFSDSQYLNIENIGVDYLEVNLSGISEGRNRENIALVWSPATDESAISGQFFNDWLSEADWQVVFDTDQDVSDNGDLSNFEIIFVCLGIYGNGNYVLDDGNAAELAAYLDGGGSIYMEGGDTWYYDSETVLHPYFYIDAVSDGSADLDNVHGVAGTFNDGFEYPYTGANSWMDRMAAIGTAEEIWENPDENYFCGVSYVDSEIEYQTIGTSFLFGGLGDDPSEAMAVMMEWYDLTPDWLSVSPTEGVISGGENQDFTVNIEFTSEYTNGEYWGVILIEHNATNEESPVEVPVHVVLTGGADEEYQISVPDTSGAPGDVVALPVFINDVADSSIMYYEFIMTFNSDVLSCVDAEIEGTVCGDWELAVDCGSDFVDISCEGDSPLVETGILVYINFQVIGDVNDISFLEFNEFMFNDGYPEAEYDNPLAMFEVIEGTGVDNDKFDLAIPEQYQLHQNYPNPFNPNTTIAYQLPEKTDISLKIYNTTGQLVKTLVDGEQEAGYYSVKWHGNDDTNNAVSSGIYFYQLETDRGYREIYKMILLR